ncbi:MAG TPA: ion channel [Bryobacteraceae bacterium]|nr:ion channel [Bryobacteraceae bacterium]
MKQESFDPGLTTQFSGALRRTINADGTFNVRRKGLRRRDANLYLKLIDTTWPRFFLVVLVVFIGVNLLFAGSYLVVGIDHLHGSTELGPFAKAFFFSVHTLTTVGYGSVYPEGDWANGIAALEAATGLMVFAVVTGLLYGRFSRPTAKILFSNNALITPYQDGTSFQFRITNARTNVLMNLEARVLLMTVDTTDGQLKRSFVDLPLERRNVYFFPLTWTIVHPIDSSSPLYGKNREDLARLSVEFLILIQGFDDTFSQQVHARFSYRHDQIVWGAKFTPAFSVDSKGDLVLEVNRIHELRLLSGGTQS